MASYREQKELRIVLVGKTGCGKSSLGNSLLSKRCFKSSSLCASVTSFCSFGEAEMKNGKKLVIVDTPGVFDTGKEPAETQKELSKCIGLSSPGPHVFIFVLKVGRVTKEEVNTVDRLIKIFGEEVLNHVIVVFTEKDKLTFENMTLEDYITQVPKSLSNLLKGCENRYTAIDNHAKGNGLTADVDRIMGLVQDTLGANGGNHYTREMYQAAEKVMQMKMAAIEQNKKLQQEKLEQRMAEITAREESVENSARQLKQLRAEAEAVKNRDPRSEARQSLLSKIIDAVTSIARVVLPFLDI